jgi:hypothetical protein
LLERCEVISIEMLLAALYDGQTSAEEMWKIVLSQGFQLWSLEPAFLDPKTGRMLAIDGLFAR